MGKKDEIIEFLLMFYPLCSKHNSYLPAYEEAERLYLVKYGKRKYIDYDCFKSALSQFRKSQRKKVNNQMLKS